MECTPARQINTAPPRANDRIGEEESVTADGLLLPSVILQKIAGIAALETLSAGKAYNSNLLYPS